MRGLSQNGIVPVDRTVVTPQMLAPSKDSSHQVITPVIPPTPVRKVTEYLLDVLPFGTVQESPATLSRARSTQNPAIAFRTQLVANELKDTSAAYLFQDSPIKLTSKPSDLPAMTISHSKTNKNRSEDHIGKLLAKKPKTCLEQQLHEALEKSQAKAEFWKT
jgi:hypothetical protein